MKEINDFDELRTLMEIGKPIILDFYASWCGPCKRIAPFFQRISLEYPSIEFVKVNVDEAEKIAEYFSITAMPTFIGIKNKEVVKFLAGASEAGILDILNKIKN
jgi:thioredoxin 1